MRTVPQLIEACGGPEKIEAAAGQRPGKKGIQPALSHWAVRKWPKIGIPERHWPLVMRLANTDIAELYAANTAARSVAA